MACNLFLRLIKHQDYSHSTVHLRSSFTFKLCVEVAAVCMSYKQKRSLGWEVFVATVLAVQWESIQLPKG